MKKYVYPALVSIVIPTYKGSYRLSRAIDSILSQDYPNIEIIVVDDNPPSSDGRKYTSQLMEEYTRLANIKYVKHKNNCGGSAARNTGISKSSGSYICFLDDDDYYLNNKISAQVTLLETNSKIDAATCNVINKKPKRLPIKDNFTVDILLLKMTPSTPSLMFRRKSLEILNGFNIGYKRHQDYELLLRFFKKYRIGVVDLPLVVLDGSGNSNEPNGDDLAKIKDTFLNEFDELISQYSLKYISFKKRVYAVHYSDVVFAYLREKNYRKAISSIHSVLSISVIYGLIYLLRRTAIYIKRHTIG